MKKSPEAYFWDGLEQRAGIALVSETGEAMSYGDLLSRINELSAQLNRSGQLVAILADNSFGTVASYLACLRNRVPFLLLDSKTSDVSVRVYIDRYKPSQIIVGKEYQIDVLPGSLSPTTVHSDIALLLPTSGSTGDAKLVMLSRSNLHRNASAIVDYLSIDANERAITSLPFAYSYGLSVVNSHLMAGATVLLSNRSVLEREFWRQFAQQESTSLAGVPFQYEMLEKIRFRQMDLPRLRTLTQAGGRIEPALAEKFACYARETGRRFFIMYGQTEATARIAYLEAHVHSDKIGCIGKAIPGGELCIIDESGDPVGISHKSGELVYHGPNVMLGYARCVEDLTHLVEIKALKTGDLGYRDEAGFFYITGRKSRIVKLQGKRWDLDSLQAQARQDGWSLWVTGSDSRLVFALQKGQSSADFQADFLDKLALHHSLVKLIEIDQVPFNNNGKPDWAALQRMADELAT